MKIREAIYYQDFELTNSKIRSDVSSVRRVPKETAIELISELCR